MVFDVIKTGGKQYKVNKGDILDVEKINANEKDKIELESVVGNQKITAEVIKQFKGPKIRIIKHNPRKRYRRKKGHRQYLTKIRIIGNEKAQKINQNKKIKFAKSRKK